MFWRRRNGHGTKPSPQHCAASSGNGSILAGLRPGQKAEVCGVNAGCKARYRLASLGLVPGSVLQVLANARGGPLLLSIGESRLMLERGVAEKVQVHVTQAQ